MKKEIETQIREIESLRKQISGASSKEEVNKLVKQVIVASQGAKWVHQELLTNEMNRMVNDNDSDLSFYKTGFSLIINMIMISKSGLGLYDLGLLLK